VGGGYKFVYTEGEKLAETKGTVFIYPDKYGNSGLEGTFERVAVKDKNGNYSYMTYTLNYNNVTRTFIFMEYSESVLKSSPTNLYRQLQFAEDLKEQYKAEYPNVDRVYTSQVLGSMAVE